MMAMGSTTVLALNIITVWLLIEAYLMRPRGFHGEPWFVVMAYIVTTMSFVLLACNFTFWTVNIIRLWMPHE